MNKIKIGKDFFNEMSNYYRVINDEAVFFIKLMEKVIKEKIESLPHDEDDPYWQHIDFEDDSENIFFSDEKIDVWAVSIDCDGCYGEKGSVICDYIGEDGIGEAIQFKDLNYEDAYMLFKKISEVEN